MLTWHQVAPSPKILLAMLISARAHCLHLFYLVLAAPALWKLTEPVEEWLLFNPSSLPPEYAGYKRNWPNATISRLLFLWPVVIFGWIFCRLSANYLNFGG